MVVSAQFITAVQCIVSRNTSPTESCVITFGKIDGGVAPNVIATSVKIMGTFLCFFTIMHYACALHYFRPSRKQAGLCIPASSWVVKPCLCVGPTQKSMRLCAPTPNNTTGTVRTFTMPVKRMVQKRLQEIARGIAASHGELLCCPVRCVHTRCLLEKNKHSGNRLGLKLGSLCCTRG